MRPIAAASLRPRERIQALATDVRIPDVDRVRDQLFQLVRVLCQQPLDLRRILDAQQETAALPRHERPRTHHLSLGVQHSQVRAVAFDRLQHPVEREQVLQRDEGIEGHAAACITACGASARAAAAAEAHWTGARRPPPPRRAGPRPRTALAPLLGPTLELLTALTGSGGGRAAWKYGKPRARHGNYSAPVRPRRGCAGTRCPCQGDRCPTAV